MSKRWRRVSAWGALALALAGAVTAPAATNEAFRFRGYYMTFMRMPTLGLAEWQGALRCIQEDGGNTLLLWLGGAFRSRKFPITWAYNRDHQNVVRDFVRDLIEAAHGRGIRVLLAFTPFGYDGVNQYPLEHPELKARQRDGRPVELWGMHCWGYNLCPAQPESQRFMREYARELFFDFYPNADGLMIESSDYAVCHCPRCGEHFFEHEFAFVRELSQAVWQAKPEALITVYPHYFSGRKAPGLDVTGAREPFDPRWTLFFTPHSAHLDAELLRQARTSIYWDDSPSLGSPGRIRDAARKARQFGVSGFVPSLEGYTFRAERAEGGETHLAGARLKPFGFGWLPDGRMPLTELLVRVNRLACREWSRNPDLSEADFRGILANELFGGGGRESAVEEALFLQESFFLDRSWFSASPLVTPRLLRERQEKKLVTPERLAEYRRRFERIRQTAERYRGAANPGERELARVAEWVLDAWRATGEAGAQGP